MINLVIFIIRFRMIFSIMYHSQEYPFYGPATHYHKPAIYPAHLYEPGS